MIPAWFLSSAVASFDGTAGGSGAEGVFVLRAGILYRFISAGLAAGESAATCTQASPPSSFLHPPPAASPQNERAGAFLNVNPS